MEPRIPETIADGITLIKGDRFECCIWLVEGKDSALLIDTGLGFGGLKADVEKLTKLPFRVVNTHGHGDHAGGNYEFGQVYLHPAAMRWAADSAKMTRGIRDEKLAAEVRAKIESEPVTFIPVREDFEFDLGGRSVRVIEVPGHSEGDIALIDSLTGIVFCGDLLLHKAGSLLTEPHAVTVADYYRSLQKLAALPSITGFCSGHDRHMFPADILDDSLKCAAGLLDGSIAIQEVDAGLPRVRLMCMKAEYGAASIRYFNDTPFSPK